VLQSENPEESEEIAQFLPQIDVLTANVKELLEGKEYKHTRHDSFVSEY
jgi:hypothetical protein